jgi:hypothetical protein
MESGMVIMTKEIGTNESGESIDALNKSVCPKHVKEMEKKGWEYVDTFDGDVCDVCESAMKYR